MKNLICLAHRGEAQTFLKDPSIKMRDFYFSDFYEAESFYLLIMGEGPQNASERVMAVLSRFYSEILGVLNFGICADLRDPLPLLTKERTSPPTNDLQSGFWIRTSYLARPQWTEDGNKKFPELKFEFRTVTCDDIPDEVKFGNHRLDCLTVDQRLFNAKEAERLCVIAPLADRELWGITSVCQTMKKPIWAYKLVSDQVQANELNNPNLRSHICQQTKALAETYSTHFYEVWTRFKNEFTRDQITTPKDSLSHLRNSRGDVSAVFESLLRDSAFHFTFTLKNSLLKYLHRLSSKELEFQTLIANIKIQSYSPKDRAQALLLALADLINPFEAAYRKKLQNYLLPLKEAGFNPLVHEESETVELRWQHSLHKNIDSELEILKTYKWENLRALINGQSTDSENPLKNSPKGPHV